VCSYPFRIPWRLITRVHLCTFSLVTTLTNTLTRVHSYSNGDTHSNTRASSRSHVQLHDRLRRSLWFLGLPLPYQGYVCSAAFESDLLALFAEFVENTRHKSLVRGVMRFILTCASSFAMSIAASFILLFTLVILRCSFFACSRKMYRRGQYIQMKTTLMRATSVSQSRLWLEQKSESPRRAAKRTPHPVPLRPTRDAHPFV
jgi:hypothetical protein